MKRVLMTAAIVISTAGATSVLATTAPKDGGPLPRAYLERQARDRTAYKMRHAWVEKTRRIKEARERYLAELERTDGPLARTSALPAQYAVAGTVRVPVFAGYFQGQSAPYVISSLDTKLFTGASGTVTDYYDEVSYGNLNMVGDVYGWTAMANADAYYAGAANGTDPDTDHTGEFIKELLDANDGAVNFGQYDNDGPDGVANSGDDDGFVDFIAVVHNERGAECDNGANGNIWSHTWVYEGWNVSGGLAYETNDARSGGGFIKVSDYTIQPALNCDVTPSVIDVGVFCHEFGHAFGLPDLYDTFGNDGSGIGHWCIMGSGNWNTPDSPAHPCAWTRSELGWVVPVEADWTDAFTNIPAINSSPTAFKLPFTNDRFRRSNACVINGSWSLYCGLSEAEETARHWASPGPGGGYGSNWRETVEREFAYSGSGAVTMTYNYDHDIEAGYDPAYAIIEVMGSETVLATYNGIGSGAADHELTPYLAALTGAGGTYTLKFRVTSDLSFADDDGKGDGASACGAFIVDDVAVTGGGENYASGFETYVDGWHQDPAENPSTEYWLVENRRATGFDAFLHGQGLLIMHVDDGTMDNPWLGNSGGLSNVNTRGVVVEEANGDFDLNGAGSNRGENTDVFPGAANKTSFTSITSPGTNDNANRTTRIAVTNISAAAATMTANLRAGDPAPQASAVAPALVDNDQVAVTIAVTGDFIRHGATFRFSNPTVFDAVAGRTVTLDGDDIVAGSLEWVDPVRLVGTVNVYSKTAAAWDLVVTNPDGQSATLPGALTINFKVATQLLSAWVQVVAGAVELTYELSGREEGETLRLYRSMRPNDSWRLIANDLADDGHGLYTYRDAAVEPGGTYDYRLESVMPEGDARELHRATATVPAGSLALSQNVPNPFNPTTSIHFYLPARTDVALEVYDVSGTLVKRLAAGSYGPGPHDAQWNGRDENDRAVASGVYMYRLTAGSRSLTRKMVLLK